MERDGAEILLGWSAAGVRFPGVTGQARAFWVGVKKRYTCPVVCWQCREDGVSVRMLDWVQIPRGWHVEQGLWFCEECTVERFGDLYDDERNLTRGNDG